MAPAPSPEQTEKVQAALKRARQLLAERDPKGAAAAVKEAQQEAGEGPLLDTIEPTASLTHYVGEFWKAVQSAMPMLSGSEITVGETAVFVIQGGPDRLLIRTAGQNREYNSKTLPAGLARKIAENWMDKSAASKVIVGAFLAVDPMMLSNSGRDKARRLWNEAAAAGADVTDLLKVLDEPAPEAKPGA